MKSVTRDSLYYRLKKNKLGGNSSDNTSSKHSLVGATVITNSDSQGKISDVTDTNALERNELTTNKPECEVKIGGRKKGTTKEAKIKAAEKEQEVLLRFATLYKEAIDDTKKCGENCVPNGTLKSTVLAEEQRLELPANSISLHIQLEAE